MILLFCTSHLYVPATIGIISKEKGGICIYTDRESISIFFASMYPEIDVFLLRRQQGRGLVDVLYKNVRESKRQIRAFFDLRVFERAYFFHEGFCEEANWLIRSLWKKNKTDIYYMPVERTFDDSQEWEEAYDMKSIIKKIYCLIYWGVHIHYYKYLNSLYPVMDKSFFCKNHCKEIPTQYETVDVTKAIDTRLLKPHEFPYSGILWLENSLSHMNVKWSEKSYVELITAIISGIPIDKIFFKGHPDSACKYGEEVQFKEVPSFIPGNLLLKRFVCFIGLISDLMFEAANAGTLTISMLYLIEMDERDRELLVEYLRKRSHNIEFPKCMSEFFELVNTL